ncbi:hypothetical protein D3C76_1634860 [compost metagenome]
MTNAKVIKEQLTMSNILSDLEALIALLCLFISLPSYIMLSFDVLLNIVFAVNSRITATTELNILMAVPKE